MRVGILELLKPEAEPDGLSAAHTHWITRQYASITPQAVSVWCRQLGHQTFYATYFGQADPKSLLPADLDVVFMSTCTRASLLAYALAKLYRRERTTTVIGGPHAKAYPADCRRFFDVVVGACDKNLISEILRDLPRGEPPPTATTRIEFPSVEERLPEIKSALFWRGRPYPSSVIGLLASVGCPYRCDFCTDWDTPYTLLSLDRLQADLRFVSEKLPRAKVAFHDSNFAVQFDPVMRTLELIPPRSRVSYMIESSLSVLHGSRLTRLRETNCWYAAAGVESWVDYANKTGSEFSSRGRRKLEQVVERFRLIGEQVPVVQANFIFGIDGDAGEEPVELTREFISRAPFVWPNLCVPTPFAGAPLYDRHRREERILEKMPFAFYNSPYLTTIPKHYGPAEYYEKLIGILEHLTAPTGLLDRFRARGGSLRVINSLRTLGVRRVLKELRTIRALLRNDCYFRAFHEGKRGELPVFYRRRGDRMLARYAEILSPEDRTPLLPPASETSPVVKEPGGTGQPLRSRQGKRRPDAMDAMPG